MKRIHDIYANLKEALPGILDDVGFFVSDAVEYTNFNEDTNEIEVNLEELTEWYKRPECRKRIKPAETFNEFLQFVLLHEAAHAQQFKKLGLHGYRQAHVMESDLQHPLRPMEIQADQWAKEQLMRLRGYNAL